MLEKSQPRVAAKIPVLAMDSPPLQQAPGWAHTLKPGMNPLHQRVASKNGNLPGFGTSLSPGINIFVRTHSMP